MNLTCTHCLRPVARGNAVLRSRSFEQVAWHPQCYKLEQGAVTIPEQRQPDHDTLRPDLTETPSMPTRTGVC